MGEREDGRGIQWREERGSCGPDLVYERINLKKSIRYEIAHCRAGL